MLSPNPVDRVAAVVNWSPTLCHGKRQKLHAKLFAHAHERSPDTQAYANVHIHSERAFRGKFFSRRRPDEASSCRSAGFLLLPRGLCLSSEKGHAIT